MTRAKAGSILGLTVIFMFTAGQAHADVVWPSLYLETGLFSWLPISAGLLVEYLFVRKLANFGVAKAIQVDVVMNLFSTLIGAVLIPVLGVAWEFFPGTLIYRIWNLGTFNPLTWGFTFLMAVAVNSCIESLVVKFIYKVKGFARLFWWLAAANSISVGLAFLVFMSRAR